MSYPPPPWHTRGWAVFRAYLVPASAVRPPDGFEVEARAGFTIGLLGAVDYRPPSPLVYRELLWMPGRVRARRADGRTARGFWVAKMFVDDEASLAGGRELWALPKQLARFSIGERAFEMHGEDGSRVHIELGRRWPALPARSTVLTLSRDGDELVRFRGDMHARAAPRRIRASASGLDGTWQGFSEATPLGPGLELSAFSSIMQTPERFTIALR